MRFFFLKSRSISSKIMPTWEKNVESWTFQSCLGAHLIPWWKSTKSQRRKILYSRWPPSQLVTFCYTIKSCKFLDICHRKTILGCILMCRKTENTVESLFQHYSQPCRWKSNIAAITKRILSTTSECDAFSLSGGLGSHETPLNYIPEWLVASLGHFFKGLRCLQWKSSPIES